MNPFQRLGVKISNWWRGEPQDSGGVVTLNSPSFLERIGLKRKGKPTSEVTYFTCLKMLSETLAKMPIKYYQKTDKGIIEAEATDTSKLLSKRPNPFMTPTTFWNTVEINRNHYGNAYVYIRKKFDRKKYGGEIKIVDLWVMQSNCVQIVVDDAGIFAGVGRLWYVYTDPTSGRQYVFSTDEVMHFKTSFSFDGITGLPVQQILRDTVAGASESQAFMNNLYESGLTAKATLEYTGELNEKAKTALVKSFEEFGSGAKNTGKILPVPLGMKLTPPSCSSSSSASSVSSGSVAVSGCSASGSVFSSGCSGSSVSSGSDAPFKYAAPAIVNGTMLPFASRTSPPSASSMSSLRLASFGLIIIPPTPFLKYSICVFESVRNNTFSLNL